MPKVGEAKKPEVQTLKPFWATTDGSHVLYLGDVLQTLRRMKARSVQTMITSPPYWALRDYGTGDWEGGEEECEHEVGDDKARPDRYGRNGTNGKVDVAGWSSRDVTRSANKSCGKCGAKRVDHQLGSEELHDCRGWAASPQTNCAEDDWRDGCHVCRMRLVFKEMHRVLRDDGTIWVNYGDNYSTGSTGKTSTPSWVAKVRPNRAEVPSAKSVPRNHPAGNLVGQSWTFALALQADGWILRQDIIYAKKSVMPESIQNRCTKAHEYVFLMAKQQRYFCDMQAVREPLTEEQAALCLKTVQDAARKKRLEKLNDDDVARIDRYAETTDAYAPTSRNKRDVWLEEQDGAFADWVAENHPGVVKQFLHESGNKKSYWRIAPQGYAGAHYATFGRKLIEPMVLAGTSERGCCCKCGAPWKRVMDKPYVGEYHDASKRGVEHGLRQQGKGPASEYAAPKFSGWSPTCECFGKFVKRKVMRPYFGSWQDDSIEDKNVKWKDGNLPMQEREVEELVYESELPLDDHPTEPCVVMDIFMGSGTTASVALEHGRRSVGIELSEKYVRNNYIPRMEGELSARPGLQHLDPGRKVTKIEAGKSLGKRSA